MTPRKDSGFTLVEVLVALFVFSILTAATFSATSAAVQSKAQMEDKAKTLSQVAKTRILLKSDLAQTLLLPRTDQYGQDIPVWFTGGAQGSDVLLSLSRTGYDNPGGIERRSNLQEVQYALDGDMLIRKTSPRFGSPDTQTVISQNLLDGIDTLEFRFLGRQSALGEDPEWLTYWVSGPPPGATPALPKLAELTIKFNDGRDLTQVFFVGADQ